MSSSFCTLKRINSHTNKKSNKKLNQHIRNIENVHTNYTYSLSIRSVFIQNQNVKKKRSICLQNGTPFDFKVKVYARQQSKKQKKEDEEEANEIKTDTKTNGLLILCTTKSLDDDG